ncbi:2-C-methyl-D-erythritol 4-phosphate cytidylyltransferase [Endozoicomonas sp. SCSIO W0465]|uniref:2-C-methyl-D-erythritol 4-phosphate cytidylyltransferase n=1 Tax=Endozoicomonas sp. SCSIO W0465 TaxID=2918516 RepID=UPI00207574A9|nr:2-C-methyl-D-erythritol 4-phosphate cytidylyltransferase [Endozoicomonas sp. SCSIO W0465]USE33971.1 2-C-methyl-D-erythritol 4-phosphate cytidylyltransferase [Endozoicomonas sp. SCSIO W0465]
MSSAETMNTVRYWAVVPAAGVGRRMNVDIPKQYLEIKGKPLMVHTLERLLDFPRLEKIVMVLDRDDEYHQSIELLRNPRVLLAQGGEERYHSVLNGLSVLLEIGSPNDWVLVHDVARPCIRRSDMDWLVNQLNDHPVGGLLGSPVTDTIKRAGGDGLVSQTVDRQGLWHAMTPQMFRLGMLHEAMAKAIADRMPVTDEASAIEYSGKQPVMVKGHADNIKVTRGTDLALASLYLEQQSKLIEVT